MWHAVDATSSRRCPDGGIGHGASRFGWLDVSNCGVGQPIIERMQSRFAAMLPAAWDAATAAALLVGAGIIALLLHTAILALVRRALGSRQPFLRTALGATKGPTRLALFLVALAVALPATPLSGDTQAYLARLLALATICLLGWAAE